MRILFVLIVSIIFIDAKSQQKYILHITECKDSTLKEVTVKDTNLYIILDSIMTYEQECKYYSESVFYQITVSQNYLSKEDSVISMQIEPNNRIGMITTSDNIAYFYYNDKLFVVDGSLYKLLFSPTGKTKIFPFEPYDVITSDHFSMWIYRYIDKKFVLEGYERCNDKKATYLIPPTKGEKIVY